MKTIITTTNNLINNLNQILPNITFNPNQIPQLINSQTDKIFGNYFDSNQNQFPTHYLSIHNQTSKNLILTLNTIYYNSLYTNPQQPLTQSILFHYNHLSNQIEFEIPHFEFVDSTIQTTDFLDPYNGNENLNLYFSKMCNTSIAQTFENTTITFASSVDPYRNTIITPFIIK